MDFVSFFFLIFSLCVASPFAWAWPTGKKKGKRRLLFSFFFILFYLRGSFTNVVSFLFSFLFSLFILFSRLTRLIVVVVVVVVATSLPPPVLFSFYFFFFLLRKTSPLIYAERAVWFRNKKPLKFKKKKAPAKVFTFIRTLFSFFCAVFNSLFFSSSLFSSVFQLILDEYLVLPSFFR